MNRQISNRISSAKDRIDEAEQVLKSAIAGTDAAARADKVTVDAAVGEALQRLHDARAILDALELSDPADARD